MFYLDFEEKLEKLESEKKSLQKASEESGIDITSKILSIEEKERTELEKIYSNLSPWQIVKIARHPQRPKTKDYIQNIFENFTSLYGDRLYSEDNAVISGMAFLDQNPVLVLGTEKGHDMNSRIKSHRLLYEPKLREPTKPQQPTHRSDAHPRRDSVVEARLLVPQEPVKLRAHECAPQGPAGSRPGHNLSSPSTYQSRGVEKP